MSPPGEGAGAPLRILVVNWLDRENPRAGGAEAHLHETFGRLASRGHRVTVLASGWPGCAPRATLDGIDVHRAGTRHTFSWAAPWYHRRHLRDRTFDVVVEDLNKVPLFTPYWVTAPVALLVHHLFGRTAFHEASFPVALATFLLERPIPRVFRGRPTVAVSESTRIDLVERGLDPGSIEVIPNGVDAGRFHPDPEVARYAEPTVLYLGRLKRYKGVDLVIRAVGKLAAEGRAVRLLVGGEGDHRPALESLVRRLGLGERVRFLGFVPEESKVEVFRRAWAHALASPKEGWGIACLEAGACGTPTVASDAPGLRDAVEHGRTGYLVRHGDVDALARALARVLDDPEARESMGREARRFAAAHSWDASAGAMERFLPRVVAAGRARLAGGAG